MEEKREFRTGDTVIWRCHSEFLDIDAIVLRFEQIHAGCDYYRIVFTNPYSKKAEERVVGGYDLRK